MVSAFIPMAMSFMVAALIPMAMSLMMSALIPASMPMAVSERILVFLVSFFPVTADFIQK